MTVKELIEKLKRFPSDSTVYIASEMYDKVTYVEDEVAGQVAIGEVKGDPNEPVVVIG